MDRRTYLGAAGGLALTGLAGCTASASERPPQVPTSTLESGGWKLVSEGSRTVFEDTVAGIDVTATAKTRQYTDAALNRAIAEKTLDQVEGQFASFFASRITFEPNALGAPGGVGRDEILARSEAAARSTFESRLAEAGLTNVEQTGEGELRVDTGQTARQTDYSAVYAVDGLSFPLTDGESISIEGVEVAVNGHLALWVNDGAVLVAGGAYPAENFQRSVDRDLTSAVSVSVDVDLGLTPEQYRSELFGLLTAVE